MTISDEAVERAALKPVAYRYDCIKPIGDREHLDPPIIQRNRANMDRRYWTETPLYAHPPADTLASLQRERDQAVEALRWYAEQGANCRKFTNEGGLARANLDRDGGERARATLASIEGAEDAG